MSHDAMHRAAMQHHAIQHHALQQQALHRYARLAVITLLGTALLAGCASRGGGSQPIVDLKGVDPARYQRDLAECQAYAAQVDVRGEVGRSALGGAIIGGAMGAIVGNHETAERMAGVGAVTGTARGGVRAVQERRTVLRNCLVGRGYRVLN